MKRTKSFFVVFGLVAMVLTSCLTINEVVKHVGNSPKSTSPFSNSDAIGALKDALCVGASDASGKLSKQDAYFKNAAIKILLPEEAATLISAVNKIPGGEQKVADVVLRINRVAESASKEIVPIFTEAITSMTISDGISIVKGGNTSATSYLKDKTYSKLVSLYQPKVARVLKEPLVMNVSAQDSWETLVSAYNKVGETANKIARIAGQAEPMPSIKVDLSTYVTQKALDGVFYQVANEEQEIRANPMQYTSDLIKKVFGALL